MKKRIVLLVITIVMFGLMGCDKNVDVYEVSWLTDTGKVLETTNEKAGSIPFKIYEKESSIEWDYRFEGWSLSVGGEVLESLPAVNNQVTYCAVMSKTRRQYTITMVNTKELNETIISNEWGATLSAPEDLTREGYTFMGWYMDPLFKVEYNLTVMPKENVMIFAKWQVNEYNLTLQNFDGSVVFEITLKCMDSS